MSKLRFCLTSVLLFSFPAAMWADPPKTAAPLAPQPGPAVAPAARPQHPTPRQIFQWLDKNHDGYLTLQEFLAAPWVKDKAQAEKLFVWMDTNKDGRVSLQEWLAAYARQTQDYATVQSAYVAGGGNYAVQLAYPCGWNYWWPWRYGWHWNNGWNHRPGVWWGWGYDHWRPIYHYHPGHHHHGHHGHHGHHHHGHHGHHGHHRRHGHHGHGGHHK
jgi:hypothetical protein